MIKCYQTILTYFENSSINKGMQCENILSLLQNLIKSN